MSMESVYDIQHDSWVSDTGSTVNMKNSIDRLLTVNTLIILS